MSHWLRHVEAAKWYIDGCFFVAAGNNDKKMKEIRDTLFPTQPFAGERGPVSSQRNPVVLQV